MVFVGCKKCGSIFLVRTWSCSEVDDAEPDGLCCCLACLLLQAISKGIVIIIIYFFLLS
jgi:hypothetical protein